MSSLLSSMDSDVLRSFSTYATIVVLKMMFMSQLTSFFRLTKGVVFPAEGSILVVKHFDVRWFVVTDV